MKIFFLEKFYEPVTIPFFMKILYLEKKMFSQGFPLIINPS